MTYYFYQSLKKSSVFLLAILLFATSFSNHLLSNERWGYWDEQDNDNEEQIDHQLFANLLQNYTDDKHPSGVNRFDYQGVTQDDEMLLNQYINSLVEIDPRDYNRKQQLAYWINLYNALTIKVILDEKPWRSILTAGKALLSKGPWDDVLTEIDGKPITLNDIEHRILRPIWNDYRIHFAVNCASIGCPNLQAKPFMAENMEQQLNSAANEYLQHERGLKFKGKKLILSEIFNWYAVDFGDDQQQVLATLSNYVDDELKERVLNYEGKIRYHYDWRLNKP